MFPDKHFSSKRDAKQYAKEMRAEGSTARIVRIAGGTYLVTPGYSKRKKRNPKRSAAASYTSYQVYPSESSRIKSFGYLKSARKYAQEEANRTGVSSIIYPSGKGRTVHVAPKRNRNPLPRGKWMKGKIKITRAGKIQFARSSQ